VQPESPSPDEWPTRAPVDAQPDQLTVVRREPAHAPDPRAFPPRDFDEAVGRGLLLALVAVALVAVAALAAWYLTHHSQHATPGATTAPATPRGTAQSVTAPSVTGLSETAAVIALGHAGLRPKITQLTTGPANGRVVSQRPAGNATVTLGSPVAIVVDPPGAKAAATAPAPTAKAKTPPATTTAAPAAPTTSTVPDLSGQDEQAAAQALYAAGIKSQIVFVPAADPLGSVEGQAKPAGTQLPSGSTMQMTISRGSGQNPDETVPDVSGKTLRDAVSALNGQQLRLIFLKQPVQSRSQAGQVVAQTPPAGAHAPRNGQVLVYLGAFRPSG
jgi:beta-lactam-binding protein with PASTA domain